MYYLNNLINFLGVFIKIVIISDNVSKVVENWSGVNSFLINQIHLEKNAVNDILNASIDLSQVCRCLLTETEKCFFLILIFLDIVFSRQWPKHKTNVLLAR